MPLNPSLKNPMIMPDGSVVDQVVHLNQVIDHPRIEIGDFSYYHHFEVLDDYASYIAPYIFPLSSERLVIGKFCQIAHGARFITSSANHDMEVFSTYPFRNFLMSSETSQEDVEEMFNVKANDADTRIGNDVWIGMNATIMPGVTVGDGAIIGAHAVVTRDVPAYSIAAGNPANVVKLRFDDATVQELLAIRWWDWPVEVIEANIDAITGLNLEILKQKCGDHSRSRV